MANRLPSQTARCICAGGCLARSASRRDFAAKLLQSLTRSVNLIILENEPSQKYLRSSVFIRELRSVGRPDENLDIQSIFQSCNLTVTC